MSNLITTLGAGIALLMGIGAIFGAINTMYSAVAARTREIATLRALGFGGGPVVVSVMVEALLLALVGGAIGGAVAYVGFNGFQVANAMAHAYRDYSIQQSNKKTFETKAFIEEQLRLTLERLKQAEHELQRFKEQYGLIALDAQTTHTLAKLNGLEIDHERAKAERVEIENQLKAVDAAGKGQNERLMGIVMAAPAGSPLERLRGQLGDLNLKRQTLLISFTEKHPQVEELSRQIQAVTTEARKDLQSLLQAAAVRESELSRRVEAVHRENMSLPEKGLLLVRLQREADLQ